MVLGFANHARCGAPMTLLSFAAAVASFAGRPLLGLCAARGLTPNRRRRLQNFAEGGRVAFPTRMDPNEIAVCRPRFQRKARRLTSVRVA